MAAETISIKDAIKSVQTGLSSVSPSTSYQVMLFNSSGVPSGKASFGNPVTGITYNDGVMTVTQASGAQTSHQITYTAGTITTDWVDMGLPSGLKWARRNIDVTQPDGFAASEFQYECSFFSWGNVQGHNPSGTSSFSYNWGTSNDGPYASTPGAALSGDLSLSNDAAHINLGGPWRMPTTSEFAELFNNIDYVQADGTTVIPTSTTNKLVTVNGVTGIYLKSKINGNLLFFPCSGYGSGQSWGSRGSGGYFWSMSLSSATNGRNLSFHSGRVSPQGTDGRFNGFAVRPVQ